MELTTFYYDKNGRKYREKFDALEDNFDTHKTFKYDKKGNLILLQKFYHNNDLENYIIYQYDSSSNKTNEIYYNFEGRVDSHFVFIYNNGILIEEEHYHSPGQKILNYESETYNEKGVLINKDSYIGNDASKDTITFFDEDGRLVVKKWELSDDFLYDRISYFYDNYCNLVEERTYEARSDFITSKIVYRKVYAKDE